jgi:predicted N-acyltransferase
MAEIRISESVRELPRKEWNELVGDASPFLEWEWLASLEEAGCVGEDVGWIPRPLVAVENERLVAACPVYVKLHSDGEFVYDWGWAEAAERAGIRYYPKLLVGIPFSPVTGTRFLVARDEPRADWQKRLAGVLRESCARGGFSGVHVNFCHREEAASLSEVGYMQRTGFQYHWTNEGYTSFEDYLGRFRSKRRNQIRRERRALEQEGVRLVVAAGDEIDDEIIERAYAFYLSTIQNHSWGRQYLNLEFFQLLRERFRDRLVFILARRGDELIGGTFNVRKGNTLYGRYWGAVEWVRHLHFNACYYAPVEYCIEAGLERFEPGAGGDYKQVRGFDAQPTFSGHYIEDPRLAHAIDDFLVQERTRADDTIDWIRDRSALKKQ